MTDQPDDEFDAPGPRRPLPPLFERAVRSGTDPLNDLQTRRLLGIRLFFVPLRLMARRQLASALVGEFLGYAPGDLCQLRARTFDGETWWVVATPRPDRVTPAHDRRRRSRRGRWPR
jgi:hypothetical protein